MWIFLTSRRRAQLLDPRVGSDDEDADDDSDDSSDEDDDGDDAPPRRTRVTQTAEPIAVTDEALRAFRRGQAVRCPRTNRPLRFRVMMYDDDDSERVTDRSAMRLLKVRMGRAARRSAPRTARF